MIKLCLRNPRNRPFLLPFLKVKARLEKAGSRFDTITFSLSDIDSDASPAIEDALLNLSKQGVEIYLDTKLKRVVRDTTAEPVAAAVPEKPVSHVNRNLERAMAISSDPSASGRPVFEGTPGKATLGTLPQPEPAVVNTFADQPMRNIPGLKPGSVSQSQLLEKTAAAGTPVPKRRRRRVDAAAEAEEAVAADVDIAADADTAEA